MSFPPTLNESLKHIAIIGRFRWNPRAGHDAARRIDLPAELSFEEAKTRVGFDLVFGPLTQSITGRTFDSFTVCLPRDVESVWMADTPPETDKARAKISSISLADHKPLIASLQLGSTPQEIGGVLFRKLLDDLDALRPFWHPDFDYHLTLAVYHHLKTLFQGRRDRLDEQTLKRLLFQPNVNARLLATLRDSDNRCEENQQTFRAALETSLAGEGITSKVAPDYAQQLLTLRQEFINTPELLPSALKGFVEGGPEQERLPADLAAQWRTFRGHFENVRAVVDCEPLLSLMIVWFFRKVAGEESIAEELDRHFYAPHRTKAVLGAEQRAQDQATAEKALDAQVQGIFKTLSIGEREEKDQLMRAFVTAIADYAKAAMYVKRSPQEQFRRTDLIDWLKSQFAKLLPYGMDAGKKIMADLEAMAASLLAVYERIGGLYGQNLKFPELVAAVEKDGSPEKKLWHDACAAIDAKLSGTELGNAFREKFNQLLSSRLAETLEAWLRQQIGATADERALSLDVRLKALSEQYLRGITFMAEQQGKSAGNAISGGVVMKSPARPIQAATAPVPQTLAATSAGLKPVEPAGEAGKPGTGPSASPEKPVATAPEQQGAAASESSPPVSEFTQAMLNGFKPGAGSARAEFVKATESLNQVRQEMVKNLGDGKPELAQARARWRGLSLAETILSGNPERSALDKQQSSVGLFLLLEMVNHVGAGPNQESRAWRDALQTTARPDDVGAIGLTKVPLWEIFKMPKPTEDQTVPTELSQTVDYWNGIARHVMDCKDYASEVSQMHDFLEATRNRGVRITFFNETLEEHVRRQDISEVCFARNIEANPAASISPPSYVWVTNQAGDEAGIGGLAQRFVAGVSQYIAGRQGGTTSYASPLILTQSRIRGLQGEVKIDPVTLEYWEPARVLLELIGALNFREPVPRYRIRRDGIGVIEILIPDYYSDKYRSIVAPVELQTRILTAALFEHAATGQMTLSRAIAAALHAAHPHAEVLTQGTSVARGEAPFTSYRPAQPPNNGDHVGWDGRPFGLDLIGVARAAAGGPRTTNI